MPVFYNALEKLFLPKKNYNWKLFKYIFWYCIYMRKWWQYIYEYIQFHAAKSKKVCTQERNALLLLLKNISPAKSIVKKLLNFHIIFQFIYFFLRKIVIYEILHFLKNFTECFQSSKILSLSINFNHVKKAVIKNINFFYFLDFCSTYNQTSFKSTLK